MCQLLSTGHKVKLKGVMENVNKLYTVRWSVDTNNWAWPKVNENFWHLSTVKYDRNFV